MKQYILNYIEYYGYGIDDVILSEVSGNSAVDIHHILPKGRGGTDDVTNLIALTREEHNKAHAYIYTQEYLQGIHDNFERIVW